MLGRVAVAARQRPGRGRIENESRRWRVRTKSVFNCAWTRMRRWGMGAALALALMGVAAGAAPHYVLVYQDGRRIEVDSYEQHGATLYYYRYGARIGVARDQIREIRELAPRVEPPPLEAVIVPRVQERHGRTFSAQDFSDDTRYQAQIAAVLNREEQTAYLNRMVYLAQQAVLDRAADFASAEAAGDVAAVTAMGQARDAALDRLQEWEQAREIFWARWGEPPPGGAGVAKPADAAEDRVSSDPLPADDDSAPPPDTLEGARRRLARLKLERDRLVLFIKQHYDTAQTGGYLEVKSARRQLAIIELQIRHCAQGIADREDPRGGS